VQEGVSEVPASEEFPGGSLRAAGASSFVARLRLSLRHAQGAGLGRRAAFAALQDMFPRSVSTTLSVSQHGTAG
jgi:hypothetical protein